MAINLINKISVPLRLQLCRPDPGGWRVVTPVTPAPAVCVPSVTCTNPVREGCCPSCSQCEFRGCRYDNGAVITGADRCRTCICQNGNVECQSNPWWHVRTQPGVSAVTPVTNVYTEVSASEMERPFLTLRVGPVMSVCALKVMWHVPPGPLLQGVQ